MEAHFKRNREKLVEELLIESEKIIASIETQIQFEMKDRNLSDFLRQLWEIDRKHAQIKHQLKHFIYTYLFTLCLMLRNYKVDTKMIILTIQNYECMLIYVNQI